MGNLNWQKGSIRVPTSEWLDLTLWFNATTNVHRSLITQCLKNCTAAITQHPTMYKVTKHEFSLTQLGERFFYGETASPYIQALLKEALTELMHPTKKDTFAQPTEDTIDGLLGPRPKAGTTMFGHSFFSEWSLTFDNETKTLTWNVPEGDNAVARAHMEPLVGILFERINGIDFGTDPTMGGVIVGSGDKRNTSDATTDVANYVCMRFGNAGADAR